MTKNSSTSNKNSPLKELSPFPIFDPAEFGKFSSKNLAMATQAATAYFKGASKLNQEMMNFVNQRVKKDIATAQNLMSCRTSEQAFHCQAEFVEGAIRDYADETSKLLNIAADMAQQTLHAVEERTEEVLHKMDERGAQQESAAE